MSLGAGRGGFARGLLCTVPVRESSGWPGPSLACPLAHRCHNQLVAQGCICQAALITIVTRALFLAGFVPLAAWQSGAVSSMGRGWLSSRAHLCIRPLPLCDTSLTLPIACWLLSWLLSVPFPSLPHSAPEHLDWC